MIDIHSRFIVGPHLHATESAILAAEMMKGIFAIHGIPQVVHADRGTSMTFKTVAALLSDLEVTRLHSRPRVFIDNPYSDYAGIGFHTPVNVHYGLADGVTRKRSQTLAAARAKHPHRFRPTTDPKILALPGPA